jgi:hypothetical protein
MMQKPKIRTVPRISISKLGEYMVATPARRRGIIRDQKQPREVIVARYNDVYGAVAECLLRNGDVSTVHERLEKLYQAVPKTTWEAQDKQLSADALEAFLTFVDEIDLSGLEVVRPGDTPMMQVGGVGVSVRPELLLRRAGETTPAGAVKLYVSKLFALDDKSGAYVATVLHQFVDDVISSRSAQSDACIVIDIFERRVHVAPRAYKKRRNDIEAACEEIAQRWAAV